MHLSIVCLTPPHPPPPPPPHSWAKVGQTKGLDLIKCLIPHPWGKSPTKLHMLFPAHLQARELCPQTYSLSLPLEWSQVTHIPASIKLGGAYKPEKSAFYSTFARQLCDDTRLPGWLSATLTNIQAHSGKLCTHK